MLLLGLNDKETHTDLVLNDDVSDSPILDFDLYKNAIVRIVSQSCPKFSIGVFGDWGTGKTTLMNSIYNHLKNESRTNGSFVLVWFNAWRYEREEHFAIIPLLKTIELAIPEKKYSNLKEALKEAGLFGIGTSKEVISSVIGSYFGREAGDLIKHGIGDLTEKIIPNLKKINEIENSTIYFDGQRRIESEIKSILDKDSTFRIIVFVDDLDRCSPDKVIEVFESIKVFLGMDGFIYILGLSHEKISQLINKKYEFEDELEGIHKIKKIIQIPITLPRWNKSDISILLDDILEQGRIDKKI